MGKNEGCIHIKVMVTRQIRILSYIYNRATSRFEAHLVYKHTQKPDFLISNAR